MTLPEAIDAVRQAGAELVLSPQGRPRLKGDVAPEVVDVLRRDRERVAAVLRLRAIHEFMGFNPDDVAMIEAALLSGRIAEIRVAVRAPGGAPA